MNKELRDLSRDEEQHMDKEFEDYTGAMEDIALIRAIKEGEDTESISRAEVFNILEGKA